jgi:hypothetical protein
VRNWKVVVRVALNPSSVTLMDVCIEFLLRPVTWPSFPVLVRPHHKHHMERYGFLNCLLIVPLKESNEVLFPPFGYVTLHKLSKDDSGGSS